MRKQKGVDRRVLRSETSFCIAPISDKELLLTSNPAILLVHNISDKEIAKRDYEKCVCENLERRWSGIHPDQVEGKYAAFGMPGGGVEDFNNRESAARNEVKAETGLSVLNIKYLFTEGKTILRNSRTEKVLKQFFHEVGKRPSIKISSKRVEVIENPIHIFIVRVEWEETNLRKIFIKMRDKLLKDRELKKSDIKKHGISFFFDEISHEEVESLGIEEVNEIDGMAIVPIKHIQELQEELRLLPREKRIMYLSHAIWINRAITHITMNGI
jgi:8-oxo-dGTP pyrophosphatase MutT (NUDIX family)